MHPETILREVEINNSPVALAIVKFSDQTMVTVSDNGTFGAFHDIEIAEMRPGTDPVVTIKPFFGYSDDFTKVVCRNLAAGLQVKNKLMISIGLKQEKINKNNLDLLKLELADMLA
ncbi:unnamed protein product [Oikopleura dioica]|uniref:Uncharacterized protein n=1 Tax=Oikopleura dioica TaxID=34765 RepID=E4XIS2_OIKDI|nr:unnamed protein product [Oikopleura dioica]CBY38579.1 unnamed protein product [Oikopleura dioica]CBY39741.1 unnamed protein product [Oikopleura dioica]